MNNAQDEVKIEIKEENVDEPQRMKVDGEFTIDFEEQIRAEKDMNPLIVHLDHTGLLISLKRLQLPSGTTMKRSTADCIAKSSIFVISLYTLILIVTWEHSASLRRLERT